MEKEKNTSVYLNKKIKLVFFGNERLATGVVTVAPTLRALIAAGYDVVAVVSNYERGTSRNARTLEIQYIADAHNIPVLLPEKPADIADTLQSYDAAVAVLVAYGRIVPQEIINIFPRGIVNIHPSLLPLHRGPTPLESVILNGDDRTGVSVMSLVKAMDAGPVYGQSEVPLSGSETKQELADSLLEIGSLMVIELLPGILDGSIEAKPQDDVAATYDKLIAKDDGKIDTTKSAERLEREIRAYAWWPKSYTTLKGKEVIITAAHVVPTNHGTPGELTTDKDTGILMIDTANGSLCIDKIKPAGKNEMTAKQFLNGYDSKSFNIKKTEGY